MIIAALQFAISKKRLTNVSKALSMLTQAAKSGASLAVLPEFFEFPYFPIVPPVENFGEDVGSACVDKIKNYKPFFSEATSITKHPYLPEFVQLAKKKKMGIVFSFFECEEKKFYNSSILINSNGKLSKVYQKMHLPSGCGYEENLYFSKGKKIVISPLQASAIEGSCLSNGKNIKKFESGIELQSLSRRGSNSKKTLQKMHDEEWKIGMGICWDQWFSPHARALAVAGADILVYPSAIGSEPENKYLQSKEHWKTVMLGHAAANTVAVVAANRIGNEVAFLESSPKKNAKKLSIEFYGASFIASPKGEVLAELGNKEGIAFANISLHHLQGFAANWGIKKQCASLWNDPQFVSKA